MGIGSEGNLDYQKEYFQLLTAYWSYVFCLPFLIHSKNAIYNPMCDFTHKLERFVKHILTKSFDQEQLYRLLA